MASQSASFSPRDAVETDRNRYNAAFCELGLGWYWDEETYEALQLARERKHCIHHYLETEMPHLLRAYDVDFLVNAIESTRLECHRTMAA